MKKTLFVLAGTALALSAQAGQSCVDVRLSAASPVVRGDSDVTVNVAVTNTCRHPVQVLNWQLPSDDIEESLFRIEVNGTRPLYLGAHYKRVMPRAVDHRKLAAGESLNFSVELTGLYDMSQNGLYTIRYDAHGHSGSSAEALHSQPIYLKLEERTAQLSATKAPSDPAPSAASTSFTGRCSSTQQSQLGSARTAATNYAVQSTSYLSTLSSGTPRYVTWFGTYSSAGRATALDHFTKTRDAFQNAAITFDCSCKKSGTYAYVYPTQPYKIYLCGAFWNAGMTGTDSKAGTLIHEMLHFNVIAGTDDWAYGQSAAKSLAQSDPAKALDNSDNHEYFAENTPAQN
ncbi:M35 family metallo-endopeptidase [Inhella gelatinilytica]|uniref:Peptidase M35 n=1 Tax=Inhella gelatinilytica TaxID=2795030 RepID=A0A931NER9_9BURK|nr:M35 family metallo-endopeptidase [Inhella gelatinilytica]MBH9552801.1 peptidase M35 [Inhella gelatinilytica]